MLSTFVRRPLAVATIVGAVGAAHAATGVCGLKLRPSDAAPPAAPPALRLRPLRPEDHKRLRLAEFARRNYSLHGWLEQQISNRDVRSWMSARVFKLEGATLTCIDERGGSLRYPVEDIDTVEVLTEETFKITFKQGAQKRELLLRPVGRRADGVRADGHHSALTWVTVLKEAKRRADSSSRFADVFEALQAEKEVAEVWEDIAGSLGFSEKVTGRCSLEQLPVTVKTFMVALRKKVPQLDSILKRVTDRLNGDM